VLTEWLEGRLGAGCVSLQGSAGLARIGSRYSLRGVLRVVWQVRAGPSCGPRAGAAIDERGDSASRAGRRRDSYWRRPMPAASQTFSSARSPWP